MSKCIPGCPQAITENMIKLRVSAEVMYLEAEECTPIILSVLSIGNFSHMNENAGSFLSNTFTKFFMRSNYYVEEEAKLYMDLQEADELRFLFQVYVTSVEASSAFCSEHFYHD
jgi:hypothetical protein